jgi:hypothetical protein
MGTSKNRPPTAAKQFFVYCLPMPRSTPAFRIGITVLAAMLAALFTPTATHQMAQGQAHRFLSSHRTVLDADTAIVLVELPPEADPGTQGPQFWADFYLTLHEMGARNALIRLPDEYFESRSMLPIDQRERIQDRFHTEFGLINKNTAILFDAIRYGSVRPKDTAKFVDDLSSLVDKSGERLLDDILNANDSGALLLSKARNVFGENRLGAIPMDIGYSLPSYDSALVIAEYPRVPEEAPPFRRLSMEAFTKYSRLEEKLERSLSDLEEAGYFARTSAEAHPTVLHSRTQDTLRDLLDAPTDDTKSAWKEAKAHYVLSVEKLLDGTTEAVLIQGFESMLAEESLDEAQALHVRELQKTVVESFDETRTVFDELTQLRNLLAATVKGACCVVGGSPDPQRVQENVWLEPTPAETAAVQIHSIRTGRYSIIPTGWEQRIYIAIPGLLFALLLSVLGLAWVLIAGVLTLCAAAAGFSVLFVYTGIFIHPVSAALVPAVAVAATMLAAWSLRLRYTWAIGPGLGARLPRPGRWVIGSLDRPPEGLPIPTYSAILTVRSGADIGGPVDQRTEFYDTVAREIKKHGGVIVGAEDFIVQAAFGTPLDRPSGRLGVDLGTHVNRALGAVSALIEEKEGLQREWSFGMDAGECAYYLSPIRGLSVEGRPAVFARILSGLAARHRHRILATEDILEIAGDDWKARKLDSLVDKASGQEKSFYALAIQKPV